MKRRYLLAVGLLPLLLLCGCMFPAGEYVEHNEFDLVLTPVEHGTPVIRLGVFRNISGSDRRFLCRQRSGKLARMEYQRWILSPELLFQRCMYSSFSVDNNSGEGAPLVSGVIYRFEFDESSNSARFAADIEISSGVKCSRVVQIDLSVPVKGKLNGVSGAEAMSSCAKQAIAMVAKEMKAK